MSANAIRSQNGEWTMLVSDGDTLPLPPFDITPDDFGFLESIDGVSLTYSSTVISAILGAATVAYRIVDGCVVGLEARLGDVAAFPTDVQFTYEYRRMLQYRLGEVEAINLLAPPAILTGDIHVAMVLAGLVDTRWSEVGILTESQYRALLSLHPDR